MKKIILYAVWLVLYGLCAALGHISQPAGAQAAAMLILSLLFFVPGILLLVDALRAGDRKGLALLRWICGASLGLTLVMLVVNILSALNSTTAGIVLHEILIFVSVPMVCSQHWLLSLFLWALLLFSTFWKKKS